MTCRNRWLWLLVVCLAGFGLSGCPDEVHPELIEDVSDTAMSGDVTDAGGSDAARADVAEAGPVDEDIPCTSATAADLPAVAFFADGDENGCHWTIVPGDNDQDAFQSVLVEAAEGSVVCLAEGTYTFRSEILVDQPQLVIRGAGRELTTLDFSGQFYGANGISARADGFHIEGLTVWDPPGDGIRVTGVRNVAFVDVGVIWPSEADKTNGAYGLYPVQCENVRIDSCYVQGASDAGIYVGQSMNIIVKDSEATGNVAGIEIENSTDAEVFGNYAHGNTGGLLIFDLPNHPLHGKRTLAHHNIIENNNLKNFAPSGVVKEIPPGSGIIVLASDDNEIRDNTITGNGSLGVVLIMHHSVIFGSYNDPNFDPYPEGNWIHDNTLIDNGTAPQSIAYILLGGNPVPNLSWGGCVDPEKSIDDPGVRNCFSDNGGVNYVMFNLCGEDSLNPETFDYDITQVTCTYEAIPPMPECTGLMGCGDEPAPPTPVHESKSDCEIPYGRLSDYEFFDGDMAEMNPTAGVYPYVVNSPLWADHAEKGRFIHPPEGTTIDFHTDGVLDMPVGTIVVKSFYFDLDRRDGAQAGDSRIVETRLYIREETGWDPQVYTWNDAQTEAMRVIAGQEVPIAYLDEAGEEVQQTYLVPSVVQCGSCHEQDDTSELLGVKAGQLNRSIAGDGGEVNQLTWLFEQGLFTEMPAHDGYDVFADPYADGDLDLRARSWLDANCAHCHRPGASAGPTELYLGFEVDDQTHLGVCKTPIAAGGGAAGLDYDIVPGDPDASIMVFRIGSTDPEVKMPELPNLAVDEGGLALIRDWIAAMEPAGCE